VARELADISVVVEDNNFDIMKRPPFGALTLHPLARENLGLTMILIYYSSFGLVCIFAGVQFTAVDLRTGNSLFKEPLYCAKPGVNSRRCPCPLFSMSLRFVFFTCNAGVYWLRAGCLLLQIESATARTIPSGVYPRSVLA
jgi:hypothetical protein